MIVYLLPRKSKLLEDRAFVSLNLTCSAPSMNISWTNFVLKSINNFWLSSDLEISEGSYPFQKSPVCADAKTDNNGEFEECFLFNQVVIFIQPRFSFICLTVRYPNYEFWGPVPLRYLINLLSILALKTTFTQCNRDHLYLPEACVPKKMEENMQTWLWF